MQSTPSEMETDPIFYRLFKQQPSCFFELIGRPASEAEAYDFSSVELKQTAFRIDGLFIPKAEFPEMPLNLVEVQFYSDKKFYARLFAELFLYLHQNNPAQNWRLVVIFGRRSYEPKELAPYQALLNSPQVQRIYLDELEAVPKTSLGMRIVQLIIEKRDASAAEQARQLVVQARQNMTDDAERAEVVDLIETVVLYKFSKLSREEVQEMVGVNEFKQSKLYQDIKLEGKLEGKLEVVPQLLSQGFTVEQTAQILGLTVEQVRQGIQET
ncbi:Rpn family recombination-promoting nuclease/putative transposase [Laspinema sp. A4]|uniref:Rpn family recombination-promoting nuclease/putative transposase n=1 Tax=Laspinema sp. D2d TaxID=2953686 RepID=UPI0021BA4361|nr:Rpn family recombination-promoting nuclease/putative transposase [Laspinema sp. D2d]MCT7985821.1 Rpn family recombination-promoting nuclease/putative transposase [Laspinema sp. D2d]